MAPSHSLVARGWRNRSPLLAVHTLSALVLLLAFPILDAQVEIGRSASVNNGASLVLALAEPTISFINIHCFSCSEVLIQDESFNGLPELPLLLTRNVTIAGPDKDPNRWPLLQLYASQKIQLADRVALTLQNVIARPSATEFFLRSPSLGILVGSKPGSRSFLITRDAALFMPYGFPVELGMTYLVTLERPPELPGEQAGEHFFDQTGLPPINDTSVPIMSRFRPGLGFFQDFALVSAATDEVTGSVLPLNYYLWFINTWYFQEKDLSASCLAVNDPVTCYLIDIKGVDPKSLGGQSGTANGTSSANSTTLAGSTAAHTANPTSNGSGGGGDTVSTGAIVGAVVGGVVGAALLAVAVAAVVLAFQKRQQHPAAPKATDGMPAAPPAAGAGSGRPPAGSAGSAESSAGAQPTNDCEAGLRAVRHTPPQVAAAAAADAGPAPLYAVQPPAAEPKPVAGGSGGADGGAGDLEGGAAGSGSNRTCIVDAAAVSSSDAGAVSAVAFTSSAALMAGFGHASASTASCNGAAMSSAAGGGGGGGGGGVRPPPKSTSGIAHTHGAQVAGVAVAPMSADAIARRAAAALQSAPQQQQQQVRQCQHQHQHSAASQCGSISGLSEAVIAQHTPFNRHLNLNVSLDDSSVCSSSEPHTAGSQQGLLLTAPGGGSSTPAAASASLRYSDPQQQQQQQQQQQRQWQHMPSPPLNLSPAMAVALNDSLAAGGQQQGQQQQQGQGGGGSSKDLSGAAATADVVQLLPVVLGKGSFGRVLEGRYRGQRVAVKQLYTELLGQPVTQSQAAAHAEEMYESFMQEVDVLGRCDHPNIARLYAACLTRPRLALVMELADTSLDKLLFREYAGALMPLGKVLHIASQIAQGLCYLHPTIVHRDLKPANVLINNPSSDTPVVKLTDFGLARMRTATKSTCTPEAGTAAYTAPECFDVENSTVTHRVDIYSFGVVLWTMLTGKEPWPGLNVVSIAFKLVMRKERLPLDGLSEERCPLKLKRLLLQCWEGDPMRRPAAADLCKELGLIAEQQVMRQ